MNPTPIATEVAVNPQLRLTLRKSAADSPTVVHKILMIQNQIVTSGTLFMTCRLINEALPLLIIVTGHSQRELPVKSL